MEILDPGHKFSLRHLDGDGEEILQFVKREGARYPGNVGHCEGTTMQEVLRALISRAEYVNSQIPCAETMAAIGFMKAVVYLFETRAARLHERFDELTIDEAVYGQTCGECGHVGCNESCRS
jgi:hypothetical protein